MEIKIMKCPNCGAKITKQEGKKTAVCSYCETTVYFDFAPGETDWDEVKSTAKKERTENLRAAFDGKQTAKSGISDPTLSNSRPGILGLNGNKTKHKAGRAKRIWLYGIFVLLLLMIINGTESGPFPEFFAAWLVYGGVVVLIINAVNKKRRKAEIKSNPAAAYEDPLEPARLENEDLPWALRVWGIIILGCFTGGLHWVVGPIIRIYVKSHYYKK